MDTATVKSGITDHVGSLEEMFHFYIDFNKSEDKI
jgi:hypothetical protein